MQSELPIWTYAELDAGVYLNKYEDGKPQRAASLAAGPERCGTLHLGLAVSADSSRLRSHCLHGRWLSCRGLALRSMYIDSASGSSGRSCHIYHPLGIDI